MKIENECLPGKAWFCVVLLFGALNCSGSGFGGCNVEELPHAIPPDQTIEGGAQIRVTEQGFEKMTSLIPAAVNDALSAPLCIDPQDVGGSAANADFCHENRGTCTPGCSVDINIDSIEITPNNQMLNVRAQFDAEALIPIEYEVLWVIDGSCDGTLIANDVSFDVDINLGIEPTSGELTLSLSNINNLDISDISFSGNCGALDNIVDLALSVASSLLSSVLGDFIIDQVTPLLDNLVQGILPDPLGLEGMLNLSDALADFSPSTKGSLEARLVPGGFASLQHQGLTLGVITGINADEDISSREPELDSEPAYCVPPIAAPDFSIAPHELVTSSRNNFVLQAANEFQGMPDLAHDLALGASETLLDLFGHHLTTSGALCLDVGPDKISGLDLGTISILVPSLAVLGDAKGKEPLRLVTRPTTTMDMTIGEGTAESPMLTVHLMQFEIDFYAFIFQRYIRGFTAALDLDIGINLEFALDANDKPTLIPTLTGIDANNIGVSVLNNEFLRESTADLEAFIPVLLEVLLPTVGGSIGPIDIPDLLGFRLSSMELTKIVTNEDSFLTIGATLGATTELMALADAFPNIQNQLQHLQSETIAPRAQASASLLSVETPTIQDMQKTLSAHKTLRPKAWFDLATQDDNGRLIEWTWRIDSGMWRPFVQGGRVAIEDAAMAFKGKHLIEWRPRAQGDYQTLALESLPFSIDVDPSEDEADEKENVMSKNIGGCQTGSSSTGLLAFVLCLGLIALRRKKTSYTAILLGALTGLLGCGPSSNNAPMCELAEECAADCGDGQVPLCIDNTCLCTEDLEMGRIGQFSSMAQASDGSIWVSAYNETYGDLMVAQTSEVGPIPNSKWQFIHGVPEGPVVLKGSSVRQGIDEPGQNIGKHTDIAMTANGLPSVVSFNQDEVSLVSSVFDGSTWQSHIIDQGQQSDPSGHSEVVGEYNALTTLTNGTLVVAYYARITDTENVTTELRLASSSSENPRSSQDWQTQVIDTLTLPKSEIDNLDPPTLPPGVGLFVDIAAHADGNVSLVHYNQIQGALHLTTLNPIDLESKTSRILDGETPNRNVGWYPSIVVDSNNRLHISYVDVIHHDLLYMTDDAEAAPILVDDGYRLVGQTIDGRPKPEFHFVGDDSSIILMDDVPSIVYQDATSHELLLSVLDEEGRWFHRTIAGDEKPFVGGYGFYAQADTFQQSVVMSSWVVDQTKNSSWVEIFREGVIVD